MRKQKGNTFSLLRNQITALSVLIILLTIFSLSQRSKLNTLQSNGPLPIVPTSPPSLLVPQAEADDIHEDYCLTVPVLLYHHVQPLYLSVEKQQESVSVGVEYFDMHMHYLVENDYTSLSAESLIRALLNREELPPKSIVITLDDGYEGNYLYAYPILKKYQLIGNFMIPTGLVGKKDYLSFEQVKEMAQDPLVRIYNHTVNHIDVGSQSADMVRKEIQEAQVTLVNQIGSTSPIFTYPYGSTSATASAVLQELGFIGAFTTVHGVTQCRSEILTLHRNHVGNLPLSSYGF